MSIFGAQKIEMDKNELKKELMRSKVEAEFSHYCAGNLYYRVATADGLFQFSIATVDTLKVWSCSPPEDGGRTLAVLKQGVNMDRPERALNIVHSSCKLSDDLGTTTFPACERASMLWRWIDKAIDAGEFQNIEVSTPPPPEPPKDRIIREGEGPPPLGVR